mmetsp:Transcript_9420/g.20895  ORF Transcript_9420/g.20895 Transcript_9420/m.20895 type:complete len:172 (-) Transcript_9420:67-582(-)
MAQAGSPRPWRCRNFPELDPRLEGHILSGSSAAGWKRKWLRPETVVGTSAWLKAQGGRYVLNPKNPNRDGWMELERRRGGQSQASRYKPAVRQHRLAGDWSAPELARHSKAFGDGTLGSLSSSLQHSSTSIGKIFPPSPAYIRDFMRREASQPRSQLCIEGDPVYTETGKL